MIPARESGYATSVAELALIPCVRTLRVTHHRLPKNNRRMEVIRNEIVPCRNTQHICQAVMSRQDCARSRELRTRRNRRTRNSQNYSHQVVPAYICGQIFEHGDTIHTPLQPFFLVTLDVLVPTRTGCGYMAEVKSSTWWSRCAVNTAGI